MTPYGNGATLCAGRQPVCGLLPWLRLGQFLRVAGVLLEPARPREPCLQPVCEAGGIEEPALLPRSAAVRVRLEEQDLAVGTEAINGCIHAAAPRQDRYDAIGPLGVLHSNGRLTLRQVFADDAAARTEQGPQPVVRAEASISDLAIKARQQGMQRDAPLGLRDLGMVDRLGKGLAADAARVATRCTRSSISVMTVMLAEPTDMSTVRISYVTETRQRGRAREYGVCR